jgi:hypothetical protein
MDIELKRVSSDAMMEYNKKIKCAVWKRKGHEDFWHNNQRTCQWSACATGCPSLTITSVNIKAS